MFGGRAAAVGLRRATRSRRRLLALPRLEGGLVGESGCGKTTTGRCILQLHKPTSGSIVFEGNELTTLDRASMQRGRRDMQIVFQDPHASLNPRMTVGTIVGEPLVIHHIGTRAERKERVRELLDLVGLNPSFTNRYPHQFSGG